MKNKIADIGEMNSRHHLPSREELNQSRELIKQWKIDIASVKLEVEAAEKTLTSMCNALDVELEAKIVELRNKYTNKKAKLAEKARLDATLSRLQALETRLEMEQAFTAGIRRIPDEILSEVIAWYLKGELPTRRLALVAKGWRGLLLATPSFWRQIRAYFVDSRNIQHHTEVLQRRIELSRSTLLDVTLSLNDYIETSRFDLFKLVAETGIERWRSLELEGRWGDTSHLQHSLAGMFTGTFTALRNIRFNRYSEGDRSAFQPIYDLILYSSPPITDVIFGSTIPSSLRSSLVFQDISRLEAEPEVITQLPPLRNLQELCLVLYSYSTSSTHLPPLPNHTSIKGSITNQQLHSLQLQHVKTFEITSLICKDFDEVIEMPNLLSLSITHGDITGIRGISAPQLRNLLVTLPYRISSPREKKAKSSAVTALFQDGQLMIHPTSLTIDLPVNTTAILAILQHWPQLQHLTFTFYDGFPLKGLFFNALTKKKEPLCPELLTLRLHSKSSEFDDDMKKWRPIATQIFSKRKHTVLSTIDWKYEEGEWHSLTSSQ